MTWLKDVLRSSGSRDDGGVPASPTNEPVFVNTDKEGKRVSWPAFPPDDWLGQLEDSFQARMAAAREAITADDCRFYHTFGLPDGEVVPGAWDLRGGEDAYLGGVALADKRVIEFGPSSGYLTFYMEGRGAEVVGFDAGFTAVIDLLPIQGWDMYVSKTTHMHMISRFQNTWWLMHRKLASRAKMVYGNIYSLPGDIGTFDVATFGNILLHLRDPFGALVQAAARTRSTLIVSESLNSAASDSDRPVMLFDPVGGENPTNWWTLSPGAVMRMVERLGFTRTRLTYHSQKHHVGHDLSVSAADIAMFTVVGERP